MPYMAPPAAPIAQQARPFESARYRSNLVLIFLLINMLGMLLFLAFSVADIIRLAQTTPIGDAETILDGLIALAALVVYTGSYIPAVVFVCMWVHRVVRNMPSLGSNDPRWSPAGAVGRCFIPFLNLIHPLSSVLDAWRGADPAMRWMDVAARKQVRSPALISGWWASWLIGNWIAGIGSRIGGGSDSVAGDVAAMVGFAVLIGAGALAIMVVRDVTARQDRKQELIATGQLV